MKGRRLSTTKRILLALAIIPAAWLIIFASGYGTRIGARESMHVGNAQGVTLTCNYLHATGIYKHVAFTTDPNTVACPQFLSVRTPGPADDVHWMAPLPTDRTVQLECRFIRYPVDGDDGLGARFTGDSPMRVAVNFTTREFQLLDPADQASLGSSKPEKDFGPNKTATMVRMFDHGSLPVISGGEPGLLWLTIFSGGGDATMFLRPPKGPLLWSRQGGCRPSQKRASL